MGFTGHFRGIRQIAISVYVLVAIIKKRLKIEHSLYTILQILSVALFEKAHISQVLTERSCTTTTAGIYIQRKLFDI